MTKQVTIYMNDEDRKRIEKLLDLKAEQGDRDILDNRGEPSMAALIRTLIKQELERETGEPQ